MRILTPEIARTTVSLEHSDKRDSRAITQLSGKAHNLSTFAIPDNPPLSCYILWVNSETACSFGCNVA